MTGSNHSPWGQPAPDPPKQPAQPPPTQSPYALPHATAPYAQPPYAPPHATAPYAQPPYAAPSYGQPPSGYGLAPSPPPYPYGGYPQPTAGTNGLAIAALVLAFFCAPAAVICGILALSQIKQRPQPGRGLAIAGIVIGLLLVVPLMLIPVVGMIGPW